MCVVVVAVAAAAAGGGGVCVVCVCVDVKRHLKIKKKAVSHRQYHVGETEVKTNGQARIWTSRSMGKKRQTKDQLKVKHR